MSASCLASFCSASLVELGSYFVFNLAMAFIAIRMIYYPKSRQHQYLFTFFIFNTITFLICYLLKQVPIEMGFALGLFAVFGILRYRTETVPIKEMTYLFLVIGLAMMNALSSEVIGWAEIIFANIAALLITFVIENYWSKSTIQSLEIVLDEIPNFSSEHRAELLQKLSERTGLKVISLELIQTDYIRETVTIKAYYSS